MDIKVGGITMDIMRKALAQARQGRLEILDAMANALQAPRTNISAYAPRIVTIRIPTEKIREVIGPGGKTIRMIIEKTGVKIDVEDDGRVNVASADEGAAARAIAMIQELTATPELDKSYMGRVERITDFGAFIEIMPGVDGLLHVSEIANYRVKDVRDELKEGEQVMVKVINIDPSGKVRLSRKALLAPDEGTAPRHPRPEGEAPSADGQDGHHAHHGHRDRGPGGHRGGHGGGGRDRDRRPRH
jgi:polyribonucleotide nucleotidyltransferase